MCVCVCVCVCVIEISDMAKYSVLNNPIVTHLFCIRLLVWATKIIIIAETRKKRYALIWYMSQMSALKASIFLDSLQIAVTCPIHNVSKVS